AGQGAELGTGGRESCGRDGRATARAGRRGAPPPPPGPLLRGDHPRPGTARVLRVPRGPVHRRGERPAGGAARQAARGPAAEVGPGALLRRAGGGWRRGSLLSPPRAPPPPPRAVSDSPQPAAPPLPP